MQRLSPKSLIFIVLLLLPGCFGGANYAPVIDRRERAKTVPKEHIVKRGETLYSIAWRYSMPVNRLAGTNDIRSPYLIFPGQVLTLRSTAKSVRNKKRKLSGTGSNMPKKHRKEVATSGKSRQTKTTSTKDKLPPKTKGNVRWKWPARGKLDRLFSSSGGVHKGIDIKGKLGEPVYAAGSGKVVYAGSGLVGYGILLIIKHDEQYLSAYGHNRKLLVSEGERVKRGQRIAEIGDTGTDEVKLHFEIRRNGKPIDPLKLLPRAR